MKNTFHREFSSRALAISIALACLSIPALGQGPARPPTNVGVSQPGQYNNLLSLSLGAPFVDGSTAQFMQRHRTPDAVFGGLEALHLEWFVGEQGFLSIDGRAIPANDEYRFKVNLDAPDKGFIRASIDNFKVRYDGAGGYFIPLQREFAPKDAELAMNRGDTWVEGGLRLPSLPDITVRYTRRFRDGTKPSLSWGDSGDLQDFGTRNIAPSYWLSDEVRHIVNADLKETFGKTDVLVDARYVSGDIANSLNVWRRPGESAERFLTDVEKVKSNHFSIRAGTVSELRSNLTLSTSFLHQNADSDIGGSRIYGADFGAMFDPDFPNRQNRDHGFLDVDGTTSRNLNSGSVKLNYRTGAFAIVPTFRVDWMKIDGNLDVTDTNVGGDGSVTLTPLNNSNDRSVTDVAGSLELRYTGVENVVFYARGDWMDRDGNVSEQELDVETGTAEFAREADDSRTAQRYLLGTNWHASRQVRIGLQGYRKIRSVDYNHLVNADGPLTYPGFLQGQDFETNDANVQIRWSPDTRFAATGRFHIRRTITKGTAEGLGTYRSSEIDGRVFTGSIYAAPMKQLYFRGYVTASRNRVKTPINELGGDLMDIVLEAKSDYVSAHVTVGAAVSEKANLEGGFFYLNADNFVDNSMVGLPYDISAEETGLSAEVKYELSPGLLGSIRYYYYLNRDTTFGGTQDYDLNLVYVGVAYRF